MSHVGTLTAANRRDLPPPCISCTYWQHRRVVTDERLKESWAEATQRRHGGFGRVLSEGPAFRGMVQYGPGELFPRALGLPAGPPGRDATLITCAFLEGDDPEGACERLLLEALADLKSRDVPAAEAFALEYPVEVSATERFLGHHTLFDRAFLERFGFVRVRAAGPVSLVRIDLRATIPAGAGLMARALRAARDALPPVPSGTPA